MPQFYASTSRGLSEALAEELRALDLKVTKVDKQGCQFEGSWKDCAKANLRTRVATRISLPVLDFHAYNEEELYNNILKHDFTKYLTPQSTFVIKAKVMASAITDQRMVALKVKDAIADQFTEKFGSRPSIDKEVPDVRVYIFGSKNEFRVSVDTSGHSLSSRGYRKAGVEAPMREHLGAGLIKLTGWDMKTPLVDPMCGSGTLLIEAALMLKNISPGTFHKKFSFQGFEHIPPDLFDNELEQIMSEEIEEDFDFGFKLYGFDKSYDSIKAARRNAEMAGVDDIIEFEKGDATLLEPPVEKGLIVTNPPHGIRLGDEFFLEELYKGFAYNLKKQFAGWQMWLLSGEAKWTQHLKMKAEKKIPIDNGGVESRWIKYKIREF